jgi:hypothetical protein
MRKREELVTRMLAERLGEIADIFREISDDLTAMSDTDAESDKTWVSQPSWGRKRNGRWLRSI